MTEQEAKQRMWDEAYGNLNTSEFHGDGGEIDESFFAWKEENGFKFKDEQ